jgi:3-deoxy-D-manno-octulosonic-acid transferase
MRWFYNVVFNIGFVLSAPWYFLKMFRRGDWKRGFKERFGDYSGGFKHAMTNRDSLWIHGVSVGEVNLVLQLIPAIQERLPNLKIVVSTTTSTGMTVLRKGAPKDVSCIYYPIDRRKPVQRALGVIHPEVMVLLEAELWPNMLWGLARRGVPCILANARISDRSFKRYQAAGFLFRELFGGLFAVGAQSEEDARRLVALGCKPESVHSVGALKFEAAGVVGPLKFDAGELLERIGVGAGTPVVVAGSTHAGEEAMIARVFLRLQKSMPDLFLVLAPRHQERASEVGRDLSGIGVKFEFRSQVTPATQKRARGALQCLVVNTTGELRSFYARADVVFVGKSILGKGGQNPIEPAVLGKPVIYGPNMENFADIVRRFKESAATVEVADEAALEAAMARLLSNPSAAADLGARARRVVEEGQGALRRTVDLIAAAVDHVARREKQPARRQVR